MYRNQLIFTAIHGKGQQFAAPKENGDTLSQFAIANIGYIEGNKRKIDAIMTDLVMEQDKWQIFNIVNSDNIYIKTVAVLGTANIEKARYLALRYFGEVEGVGVIANWLCEVTYQGLKKFLDHDQSTYSDRITSQDLEHFERFITSTSPSWSNEGLLSHGGNVSHLMLDMLQNDDEALLLDSMSKPEFAEFVKDLQDIKEDLYLIDTSTQLDALITPYGRIDILIQRLSQAIGRVGNSKVNVTNITPTKPFKRNSVVNVAVLLEFDDGQTVSIVFHNPDATPSTLANADILTSWKWLLNKRDVSVVLQPQNGENVNLQQLAVRMLQLVNKNSSRFKRTISKRADNEQKLKDLKSEESSKLEKLQNLDAEIAELQLKIDQANNDSAEEQAAQEAAAAEQAAQEAAAAEQAAQEAAAAEQAAQEAAAAEQAAQEAAAAEQAAQEAAAAEQAAQEAAAAEQAAQEAAAAEQAAQEAAAAEQAAQEAAAAEQAAQEAAAAENTDKEYLQSILDGTIALDDLVSIEDKLTDIWSRAEGTDLEPLVKEVSIFISNYALNSYNESVA
ncbi:hypothetical protein [Acinetobacter venetianus]|uniref:defense against restriction DarA-related protein n=1 Tax=Acinetobacter venetianus TaxID=52133 RepID=UPI003A8F6075